MHNLVYLIGRLVNDPKIEQVEDKQVSSITLAVQRSYKNVDGEYETDFFDCVLWNGIARHTSEYCRKGDLVGVKGRLQNKKCGNDDKLYNEVIVEKMSFLSSSNKNDE